MVAFSEYGIRSAEVCQTIIVRFYAMKMQCSTSITSLVPNAKAPAVLVPHWPLRAVPRWAGHAVPWRGCRSALAIAQFLRHKRRQRASRTHPRALGAGPLLHALDMRMHMAVGVPFAAVHVEVEFPGLMHICLGRRKVPFQWRYYGNTTRPILYIQF